MITNVNPKTGIRYGVISANSLHNDLIDEIVAHGRNLTLEELIKELQAEFGDDPDELEYQEEQLFENLDFYDCSFEHEVDGVKIHTSSFGGTMLVWVVESPHTTMARQCSPCVPGAGDLHNLDLNGVLCYNVPKDWRIDD